MNVSPQFSGEIKDGKLTIRNRQQFDEWIKSLKGEVRIIVERAKGKRSNLQNNYLWFYYSIIENETGTPANELHEFFKRKFLPPIFSQIIIKGKKIEYKRPSSTTQLNKIEIMEYLDKICALTEIPLPDTNKIYNNL